MELLVLLLCFQSQASSSIFSVHPWGEIEGQWEMDMWTLEKREEADIC